MMSGAEPQAPHKRKASKTWCPCSPVFQIIWRLASVFFSQLFGLFSVLFSDFSHLFSVTIVIPLYECLPKMDTVGLEIILVSGCVGYSTFLGILFTLIFPFSKPLLLLIGDRIYHAEAGSIERIVEWIIMPVPEWTIMSIHNHSMGPAYSPV